MVWFYKPVQTFHFAVIPFDMILQTCSRLVLMLWYYLIWFDMVIYVSNMSRLVLNHKMTKYSNIWANGTKKVPRQSDSLDRFEQVERSKKHVLQKTRNDSSVSTIPHMQCGVHHFNFGFEICGKTKERNFFVAMGTDATPPWLNVFDYEISRLSLFHL